MPLYFIYPIYTGTLAILTFVVVPRREIQRLGIYAIFFGGVFDIFNIILFTKVIGIGGYINFRPFGAFGIPFFPPMAWTAYFILFIYMLPKRSPWKYLFPSVAAGYSTFFSHVLQELGIFKWNWGSPLFHFLIFIVWHYAVWWAYSKVSQNSTELSSKPKHSFRIKRPPSPAFAKKPKLKKLINLKRLKHW